MINEKIEKRITMQVSVKIIQLISSGLYRSPASAIKELLSNSFDADAEKVRIEFHFSYDSKFNIFLDSIAVKDDGIGMDLNVLEYIFTHIGGSSKSNNNIEEKTPKGRDMIGRLGIGILSVASACKSFVIRTKKSNDDHEYKADISLSFFDDLREITKTMDKFSIGNVKLSSKIVSNEFRRSQYTIVEISDFRPPFMSSILDDLSDSYFFQQRLPPSTETVREEQFQEYFEGFVEHLIKYQKLLKMPVLDQMIATLGLMSPVEYLEEGPVRQRVTKDNGEEYKVPGTDDERYLLLKKSIKDVNFAVMVSFIIKESDNTEIRNEFKIYKPLLYPSKSDLRDKGVEQLDPKVYFIGPIENQIENEPGDKVDTLIRGYVYHQNSRILPHEFRGVLTRVYGVSIGDYFKDELRLYTENPVVLHQMMIEIYLEKGFQSIVNLDRESLFEGSRTYQYFRSFLDSTLKGQEEKSREATSAYRLLLAESERKLSVKEQGGDKALDRELKSGDIDFYKNLSDMFTSEKGIIPEIKSRTAEKRKEKVDLKDPTSLTKKIVQDNLGMRTITFEKTTTLDDFGLITIDENEESAVIKMPRFKGPRSKIWQSIFAIAATWAPEDLEKRKEFMRELYSIYENTEGD